MTNLVNIKVSTPLTPIEEFKKQIGLNVIQFNKTTNSTHQFATLPNGRSIFMSTIDSAKPLYISALTGLPNRPDLMGVLWVVNKNSAGEGFVSLDASLINKMIGFRDYYRSVGGKEVTVKRHLVPGKGYQKLVVLQSRLPQTVYFQLSHTVPTNINSSLFTDPTYFVFFSDDNGWWLTKQNLGVVL